MTYSLLISMILLGTWIVTSRNKFLSNLFQKLAIAGLLFFFWDTYTSAYSLHNGLYNMSIGSVLLGVGSLLLLISSNNRIAQTGLLSIFAFLIYNNIPKDSNDLLYYNVDTEWEILMEMESPEISKDVNSIIKHYDLSHTNFDIKDVDRTELDNYLIIGIPDKYEKDAGKIFNLLQKLKEVSSIEYNEKTYRFQPTPGISIEGKSLLNIDDPQSFKQWSLQALNMDAYYRYITDNQIQPARKAKLFILDSGISAEHEDLKEVYGGQIDKNTSDIKGHGTHCAGIAAAHTNNAKGIASMSPGKDWVELHSIKVIGDFGFGTQKSILNGIIKAVDSGADVINMSLGARAFQLKETAYAKAIAYATDKDVVIVAAAGNDGSNARNIVPANQEDVITVSAINNKLELAYFSNYITDVSYGIAAPGENILSTFVDNSYKIQNGTSMAAPHVAGLAAVLKAINPTLGHKEIHTILNATGINSNDNNRSGKVIQPLNAVKYLLDVPL